MKFLLLLEALSHRSSNNVKLLLDRQLDIQLLFPGLQCLTLLLFMFSLLLVCFGHFGDSCSCRYLSKVSCAALTTGSPVIVHSVLNLECAFPLFLFCHFFHLSCNFPFGFWRLVNTDHFSKDGF